MKSEISRRVDIACARMGRMGVHKNDRKAERDLQGVFSRRGRSVLPRDGAFHCWLRCRWRCHPQSQVGDVALLARAGL